MQKSYSKSFSKRKKSNSERKKELITRSIFLSLKGLTRFSFVLLFTIAINNFKAQNGHAINAFDRVSDMYGNTYNLSDISTLSPNPFGKPIGNGGNTASYTPTCQAGYFVLHYAPNSFLTNSTIAATIQAVICQVFSDISNFINSPLSVGTNTVKIHILCDDVVGGNYLGLASAVYIYPNNQTNTNQGFLQNQIERCIQSGVDPFTNLSFAALPSSGNFYSGYIKISPTHNWNYAINTSTQTSTQYDLYSVVLHEVLHALGFSSQINNDGFSKFGSANNYFSYFDQYLKSHNLIPLLTTNTPTCSNSNIVWNTAVTSTPSLILGTTCVGASAITDYTAPSVCGTNLFYSSSTQTIAVYTPSCFQSGSSLSHFEDMCSLPSGYTNSCTPIPSTPGYNNLYYVMTNAGETGDCFIKRYPKPEERKVFCDIGYTVKDIYASTSNTVIIANNTYSYGLYPGGTCAPSQTIIGNHDGIIGGVYQFSTTTSGTVINIATNVLGNDLPSSGLQMSCLELIYSSSASYTNNGTTITVTATPGSGIVIFKYLPKDISSGKFGPPTYVFLYFLELSCVPSTLCDHVENGGFENQVSGSCGLIPSGGPVVNCWREYHNSPALFVSACTTGTVYELGVNTLNTSVPVSSYNGTLNTNVVGIRYRFQSLDHESIQNNLAIPLIPPPTNTMVPTSTYQVTFWAMNKAYSIGNPDINPNNSPCVINFACNPTYPILTPTVNQPSGLNSLINFTVPAGNLWTQYTSTFVVPTSSVNQNCLVVGYNALQTLSLTSSSSGTVGQYIYTFIDDISIKPVNSVTFSIPGANNCGNVSFTNLAQYASTVPGTFSGTGVSSVTTGTLTTYNFIVSGTGTYPIAFTYTYNGCTGTVWENIIVHPPDFTISINSSSLCLNTGASAVAQASINSSNNFVFDWQPGYLAGSTQTINSASTVYTISAQSANCIITQTFSAPTSTACCTNSFNTFNSPVLNSSLSGNSIINSNVIIPSGSSVIISDNLLFAPNVKVTVQNGASLNIKDAHLYACTNEMWQGIVVLDGGQVYSAKELFNSIDNLIEDAIIAIDVQGQNTSTVNPILFIENTTFNKNRIAISVSNYTLTNSNYPFTFNKNVFTCRDLPFVINYWPQTGTTSAVTNTAADLRYCSVGSTTPATVLTPPYLNQGFPLVKLKSPYSDHYSQIAIQINTVGITTGTSMYGINIGVGGSAVDFNLFDGHVQFIVARNSNLTCINNVFQNTQSYTYTSNFVPGKAAIEHSTAGVMNSKLYMTAANLDVGSRFWNCHIGIKGNNIYSFNIEKAIFRSTQSSTLLPSSLYAPVGDAGICLNTNRYEYYIANNEFININNSINIPIAVGTFTSALTGSATVVGIYASNLRIVSNQFMPGTISNNYSNNAITITSPHSTPWDSSPTYTPYVPPSNGSPYTRAIVVTNNTLTNVFRGIYLNGVTGFQSEIMNNKIALKNDGVFTISQYGIKLTNSNPGSNASIGKNIIASNTVSFTTATSTTNLLGSLIYCGNNGYGICSPSVTCNNLSRGYQAFVFDAANNGALWSANTMSVPMSRGLVFDNSGIIGTQGSNAFASANIWSGVWTTSLGTFGTFVGTASSATDSPLWVKNNTGTLTTFPPANSGTVVNTLWYSSGIGGTTYTSTGGDHTCSRNANNRTWSVPNSNNFVSADHFYMSKLALYRFLHVNDSLINADADLEDFYNEQSPGSIGTLTTIEEKLYLGDLTTASALVESLDPSNTIEDNYKDYFALYLHYANNNFLHTNTTDSINLANMAMLCPGENGACVYQARALYNSVYNQIINDSECESMGARMLATHSQKSISNSWSINIYPNPANEYLLLRSTIENEKLSVEIKDLSGRVVLTKNLKIQGFFANLSLGLINGAYVIIISNCSSDRVVKKFIISK